MGLVKMTEKITNEWEDLNGIHPYVRATLYVYCDKCGSFSIKSRIGHRKAFLTIAAFILIAVGILAMLQLRDGIYWLCLCLAICILAFRYLWGDANYVCRKCGSVPTTDNNNIGYPSDMGILDIPDRLTQKRYLDYFPEWHKPDNTLKSPEVQLTNGNNIVPLIFQDLEKIKTFLLFILCIPLLMIFTVIYPIMLIVYFLWTEVISELGIVISYEKKNARLIK